ncbi:MAG: M48 family metalloprotease [Candidatus Omnitrophica bacterium]|nr:M48 family metalloprotease [Candidatus Omnitrophota bacterium]
MKKKAIWIVAISMLFLVGCISVYNPATGRKERHIFSEKCEINLGNTLAKQMISQTKMITDPEALAYVKEVGEQVVAASHRNYLNYKFYIIDSAEINAYALLGGHIFVNKGLLDSFSEPEFAFVMAHEVGHICARHGIKRFEKTLGLQLLFTVLSGQPNQKSIGNLIAEVDKYVSLGFSRTDEYLADSLGVTYGYQAGFDPKASLLVFERFGEIETEYGMNAMPVFLRSHPKPKDRYTAANIKIKELMSSDAADLSSKIKDFRKKPSK